jgi:penicillin amidase
VRIARSHALLVLAGVLVAGTAAAKATPETATILRDRWGVPHVFTHGARALERGAFADGWAQAEDRLFEMDVLRRAATGRLAAMLGPDYLPMDEVARRDGFTEEELTAFIHRLSPRDRRTLTAYRDGVNAYLREVTLDPTRLPFEFLGVPPAPWRDEDSVAVAILQLVVFGANGGQEVANASLLLDLLDRFPEAAARGIFDDLFWIDDPTAPTTIPAAEGRAAAPEPIARFVPAQRDLLRAHAGAMRRAAAALAREQGILGGLGRRLGIPVGLHRHASNAIVVGKALSASGVPILLGGPQTGNNAPSFFWEVGMHGGGYEAEGVTAPAGPGVLIGRFHDFAMTITSGIMDNVDTFVETIDPADPHRYLFRGRSLPFERRTETFEVAGGPDVTLEMLRTRHGPVFFVDEQEGVAFSRQAAFRGRELASATALLDLGFVHDLRKFHRVADRVAMSLNLHYADAAGNIAYFHRGVRPIRARDTDPRLPLDGRGTMEWRRLVPPHRLPWVVNPARGFLTNWNNKPIAGWSAGEARELWGTVDRVQVFIDALTAVADAGGKLTPADVSDLMRHAATSDIFAARLLPFVEAAVAGTGEPAGAPLAQATARMRTWVDAGAPLVGALDPGAVIYTAFRTAVQGAAFGDELGGALRPMDYPEVNEGDSEDDHGSLFSPDALFLRALLSAGPVPGAPLPPGLPPLSRDYFDDVATGTPHDRDEVLVAALSSALGALEVRFGTSDQAQWVGTPLRETFRDVGLIGTVFGPVEQAREDRGAFNLLVELGHPVRGQIIVPPGESGTFTASDLQHEPAHLRDQLPLYEAFQYREQPFTPGALEPPVDREVVTITRTPGS